LRLSIEDGDDRKVRQVLVREVQVHPVRRQFLHVDFYEVPLDHPIVVEVPVEVVGEPVGVKEGGLLNLVRRALSVRCLPGEIPEKITVDVSSLEIGSALHVADLVSQVPFELTDEEQLTVVTINAPEAIEEAAGAEEGGEVGESTEGGEVTAE
ncbi:MAG: 50S ribosomal protein L25, partial [Desulforhabdus sp.]|nr:50S ribosomal protein L25 [Desulforhabdus sp.]